FDPCWVQVEPKGVNAHAAPKLLLSPGPPICAVLPSEDSATLAPNSPGSASLLTSPVPWSSACWDQVALNRVNTHAAPTPLLSPGPPISAVLVAVPDSAEESATLAPNLPGNFFSPGS